MSSLGARAIVAIALVVSATLPAAAGRGAEPPATATFMLRHSPNVTSEVLVGSLEATGWKVTGTIPALRLLRLESEPSSIPRLRGERWVEWVRRPAVSQVMVGVPNDPLFAQQWAMKRLGVLRAWRHQDGKDSPVTVAVIDTGIDPSHPDLQGVLVDGFDFVNGDDDPADDFGHGTHVAGVIAARPGNRKGIAGLSWGAKVMPLKACLVDGSCDEYLVTAAIVYAVQQGAKVINLSLGGPAQECPPGYDLARRYAEQQGVVLVASTGNSGSKKAGNPMMYPAGCEGYIGVGAVSVLDEWAPFSEHNSSVDLVAPGVGILSTVPPGLRGMGDDPKSPGYGSAAGTSMAAPHVAGLAALLLSAYPTWTPIQVEQRMTETAVDLGKRGRDDYYGAGRIDVARALSGNGS